MRRTTVKVSGETAHMLGTLSDTLDMPNNELVETLIRGAYHETFNAPEDPEPVYIAPPEFALEGVEWEKILAYNLTREAQAVRLHRERHAAWSERQAERNRARSS